MWWISCIVGINSPVMETLWPNQTGTVEMLRPNPYWTWSRSCTNSNIGFAIFAIIQRVTVHVDIFFLGWCIIKHEVLLYMFVCVLLLHYMKSHLKVTFSVWLFIYIINVIIIKKKKIINVFVNVFINIYSIYIFLLYIFYIIIIKGDLKKLCDYIYSNAILILMYEKNL